MFESCYNFWKVVWEKVTKMYCLTVATIETAPIMKFIALDQKPVCSSAILNSLLPKFKSD